MHTYCYEPMYGGGTVAVGMCVCMCVVGVRVDKEATGLGREGEREAYQSEADWNVDDSANSFCRRRRQAVRGEKREKRDGAQ